MFFHFVNGADVRVIQRGCAGFALKSRRAYSSRARLSGRNFKATRRPRRMSSASYTTPIPAVTIFSRIGKCDTTQPGPTLVVFERGLGVSAGPSQRDLRSVTRPMNRYPLPVIVCTNRGCSGSSFSTCQILRMAALMLLSVSRKTSLTLIPLDDPVSGNQLPSLPHFKRSSISMGIRFSSRTGRRGGARRRASPDQNPHRTGFDWKNRLGRKP